MLLAIVHNCFASMLCAMEKTKHPSVYKSGNMDGAKRTLQYKKPVSSGYIFQFDPKRERAVDMRLFSFFLICIDIFFL